MNTALPLIALGIAILGVLLSPRREEGASKGGILPSLLLILVALAPGIWFRSGFESLLPAAIAFSLGVALSWALRFVEGIRDTSSATALGVSTALAGFANWLDPSFITVAQMSLIAGLGFGAWVSGDFRNGRVSLPVAVSVFASVILAADFMGGKALENEVGMATGTMFGLAGALAALIALVANRSEKKGSAKLVATPALIAVAILLILGFVVGNRLVENREAWVIFLASVIAATLLHLTIKPEGGDDSFAFLVASVAWVGIATLSFSYLKGYGMAIASVGAVTTMMILGNTRALLATGPLVGLTFYRVLRENHIDAVRALDIGQHYAVIGVVMGAVIALLPAEWLLKRSRESTASMVGRALWALTLGLVPVAMAVVLGAKGIVGFVAGLGFAGLIQGLRGHASLIPVVMTGALSAVVVVGYDWMAKLLDLTRDEKQIAFFWMAGVTLVLGMLIAIASKPDPQEQPAPEIS